MSEGRRVVFPIIGDDEILEKDTRVIMTNSQLITRNPGLQDEVFFGDAPQAEKKRSDIYKPLKPKVSYSTQHRPLNSNHSGVSSFDKMPKKTSIDESKERAKRAAAVLPERPKEYVPVLERKKEDFSIRRSSAVLNANKAQQFVDNKPVGNKKAITGQRPLSNNNPIGNMKKNGTNPTLDQLTSGSSNKKTNREYFEKKRENLFDRGIV